MLKLSNISKSYRDFHLKNIELDIGSGEYFVLLGASGAGKSIILELIAGLILPDDGHIILDEKDITYEKIQKRQTGLVFQDHAVFPHLNVRENIAYPLKNQGIKKEKIRQTVEGLAEEMSITALLDRKPETLSGGEKQRVALARTLALNPKFLLLDEPFASLDVQLKSELRTLLRSINKKGIGIIHVTHDYEEAISLADRVAVLHQGEIVQSGSPDEVFKNPKNRFVANFVGVRNFFSATLLEPNHEEERTAKINESVSFKLLSGQQAGQGFVFLRSKNIILSEGPTATSACNMFQGRILEIIKDIKGYELVVDIGIPLRVVITQRSMERFDVQTGKEVWVSFKASALRFLKR
ncbi:MAG: ABC transporter ATP-binding protein [Bacteroidales bacterium]|nr:ABC transporter ATP-binding protein [Bacteroidales bacterium]MCF8456368.1 ABC transporter ATP-binding protein [Bacteroidales bacterium]